jgi:hypothetical protein
MTDVETHRTTRWGEQYMAGTKRRMFLPSPEELRRKFGENATAAASVMGTLRPAITAVIAVMVVGVVVVTVALTGPDSQFPGWGPFQFALRKHEEAEAESTRTSPPVLFSYAKTSTT